MTDRAEEVILLSFTTALLPKHNSVCINTCRRQHVYTLSTQFLFTKHKTFRYQPRISIMSSIRKWKLILYMLIIIKQHKNVIIIQSLMFLLLASSHQLLFEESFGMSLSSVVCKASQTNTVGNKIGTSKWLGIFWNLCVAETSFCMYTVCVSVCAACVSHRVLFR